MLKIGLVLNYFIYLLLGAGRASTDLRRLLDHVEAVAGAQTPPQFFQDLQSIIAYGEFNPR